MTMGSSLPPSTVQTLLSLTAYHLLSERYQGAGTQRLRNSYARHCAMVATGVGHAQG